ncbi:MAG TPA: cytochrome C, partial [Vicinamibacteria bacterium]
MLTTASAVTMIGLWIVESLQSHPVHPYAGIVLFLILPFVFVLGLLLIPLGVLLQRRKLRARDELPLEYPQIDLQ